MRILTLHCDPTTAWDWCDSYVQQPAAANEYLHSGLVQHSIDHSPVAHLCHVSKHQMWWRVHCRRSAITSNCREPLKPCPFWCHSVVYQVPEPSGLYDVHTAMDWVSQSIKCGPDVLWIDPPSMQQDKQMTLIWIQIHLSEVAWYSFLWACQERLPQLPDNLIIPEEYAGCDQSL